MKEKHKHNKYNIDIKSERKYQMINIINIRIKIDKRCPNYNQNSLKL